MKMISDFVYCLTFFSRSKNLKYNYFKSFLQKKWNEIFLLKKSTLKLQSVLNPHTKMARSLPPHAKTAKIYPLTKKSSL